MPTRAAPVANVSDAAHLPIFQEHNMDIQIFVKVREWWEKIGVLYSGGRRKKAAGSLWARHAPVARAFGP